MKQHVLLKHIENHGCVLIREGKRHSIYWNPIAKKQSVVGRHKELSDLLCNKVCKQLDIPSIK